MALIAFKFFKQVKKLMAALNNQRFRRLVAQWTTAVFPVI
jgi:hypothetical protein